jgi:hypothetical protein
MFSEKMVTKEVAALDLMSIVHRDAVGRVTTVKPA